jgi:hypothetical protein
MAGTTGSVVLSIRSERRYHGTRLDDAHAASLTAGKTRAQINPHIALTARPTIAALDAFGVKRPYEPSRVLRGGIAGRPRSAGRRRLLERGPDGLSDDTRRRARHGCACSRRSASPLARQRAQQQRHAFASNSIRRSSPSPPRRHGPQAEAGHVRSRRTVNFARELSCSRRHRPDRSVHDGARRLPLLERRNTMPG